MWVGSMTLGYVNDVSWTPQTNWGYSFTIHTSELNIVHPIIIPLHVLLIESMSLKLLALFIILLLLEPALFIIRSGVQFLHIF